MARKRVDLGVEIESRIVAMMARGASSEDISRSVGSKVSSRTIARRMKELRVGVRASVAARAREHDAAQSAQNRPESTRPPKSSNASSAKLDASRAASELTASSDDLNELQLDDASQQSASKSQSASSSAQSEQPLEQATAKDRQVDELISRSLVWRRVQTALSTALAVHPLAAAAVVRALRAINL